MSHRHIDENIRKSNKNEGRSLIGLDTVSKACGKNNKPRNKCHESIQSSNPHRFSRQRELIGHVAAKNFNSRDTEGQGKECLIHGSCRYISQPRSNCPFPIRKQVKGKAGGTAVEHKAVACQKNDQSKEPYHHHLRYLFHAALYAEAADSKPEEHGNRHKDAHFQRAAEKGTKHSAHGFFGSAAERAVDKLPEIRQHPSGNSGVIHHEKITAEDAEPAMNMPETSLRFQFLIAEHRALSAAAAYRQFHRHDGNPHKH